METTRFMAQSLNDRQIAPTEQRSSSVQVQETQGTPQIFLSNNQLSVIGVLPDLVASVFPIHNQHSLYQAHVHQPQNKGP
jgi:hypothetical protein